MSNKALATVPRTDLPDVQTFQTMTQMAGLLFKSGLLPSHIKNEQAAFAVIQKGRELGLPPMYALSNIVVINGKPTANAECMLALVYRDHGDDAVRFVESTNQRCVVEYKRSGWHSYRQFAFTIEDAKQADLLRNQTWSKYPAAMLRARCASAVARMAFPDSIAGMYLPEELGAAVEVDSDGAPFLSHPEPSQQTSEHAPEPDPTVNTDTGEVVDGEYTEAEPEMKWHDFWNWARAQGISSKSQVESMIGEGVREMSPAAAQAALITYLTDLDPDERAAIAGLDPELNPEDV